LCRLSQFGDEVSDIDVHVASAVNVNAFLQRVSSARDKIPEPRNFFKGLVHSPDSFGITMEAHTHLRQQFLYRIQAVNRSQTLFFAL
jgi:hypothetical protein